MCVSVCIYICVCECVYMCESVCMYVSVYMCMWVCICVCVWVCPCICVCACVTFVSTEAKGGHQVFYSLSLCLPALSKALSQNCSSAGSQQVPAILLCLPLTTMKLQVHSVSPGLLHGYWGFKLTSSPLHSRPPFPLSHRPALTLPWKSTLLLFKSRFCSLLLLSVAWYWLQGGNIYSYLVQQATILIF